MQRAREAMRNMDAAQAGAVAARSRLYWAQEYGEEMATAMMGDLQDCIARPERRPLELVTDPEAA